MSWVMKFDKLRLVGVLSIALSTLDSGKQSELAGIQTEVVVLGGGDDTPLYSVGCPTFGPTLPPSCTSDDGHQMRDEG